MTKNNSAGVNQPAKGQQATTAIPSTSVAVVAATNVSPVNSGDGADPAAATAAKAEYEQLRAKLLVVEAEKDTLNEDVQELQAENTRLQKVLDEANSYGEKMLNETETLRHQLATAQSELNSLTAGDKPLNKRPKQFKIDGYKYQIVLPEVNLPGFGKLNAADILLNEGAQRRLVEIGSGAIKRIL